MTAPGLYLIDGSALAYRAHFAFIRSPLVTRSGKLVSAIYGFTHALLRIQEREHPDRLVVVFDAKGKTFRHERYPEYKATRQKMPEELVGQLADIDAVLEAMGIPCLRVSGCEADDVIGTLTQAGVQQGMEVRIVSGDKDFGQLIGEGVTIFQPGKGEEPGETYGDEGVIERMGVRPDQVVDLLALMGDASDNVPGVPKVGKKTAQQLLEQYDSLNGVYEHLDQISRPALRRTLEEHRDQAYLSQELVTIKTDLELEVGLDQLASRPPDVEQTRRLFHEYEFKSLLNFLPGTSSDSSPVSAQSTLVATDADLEHLVQELQGAQRLALYPLSDGPDPLRASLLGLALCADTGRAAYLALRLEEHGLFNAEGGVSLAQARERLGPVLAGDSVRLVGHDLKSCAHLLRRHELPLGNLDLDVELAHYCIAATSPHSLEALSLEYLNLPRSPLHELLGKGRAQRNMSEVEREKQCEYACEGADWIRRLVEPLEKEMAEKQVLELYQTLERPLIGVLARMEEVGVKLDRTSLARLSEDLHTRCGLLEKEIQELAGEDFNVNSPRQLAEILFEKLEIQKELGIKRIPKTKTGFSTAAAALAPMAEHPLVAKILEYRRLEKLRSTYVDTLPSMADSRTGKLHTRYGQAVAATGRLSSSDPNLQNIPIRTADGRRIRAAFRSSFENGRLVSADYSQVELRIMAHLSGDRNLRQAFAEGQDVHRHTASLVFHVDPEAVDSTLRTRAKAINFGILYGMGPQRLARDTGLDRAEATEFIARYFEVFADVKTWLDRTLEEAREKGYVTTILGRRRWLPELHSGDGRLRSAAENMAVNTPIQGSAADLIKKAMIVLDREMDARQMRSRMILQVHDELVFDAVSEEVSAVRELARDCMESAHPLDVPLTVDVGDGETWLEAH